MKKFFAFSMIGFFVLLTSSGVLGSEEASVGDKTDLVFTYTRSETPKEDVAANITVVTRNEIENMPASNAAEVLQNVPGVLVDFSGALGSSAFPGIQGSRNRNVEDNGHVAVYQDGVPLNMLANPFTDLSFISVGTIDRIEVYKGAASSAWGSSLGGVINIITREPDLSKPFSGEIQSSYGSFNTYRERALVSGGINRLGYLVSLSHEGSDGFMPKWLEDLKGNIPGFMPTSNYRQNAAYTKFNYYIGESSRLNFVYNYDEGRFADPSFIFPSPQNLVDVGFRWFDTHQRRAYQRLLFETALSDQIGLSIEARHQEFDASIDTTRQRIANDPPGSGPVVAFPIWDYDEQSNGVSARLTYDNKKWNRFILGFDGDWGEYDWTITTPALSANYAFYANDSFDLGRFTFTLGLRYDNNRDFGSEISPSGGMVFHLPWKDALIRAQIARGFSAPPATWVNDQAFGNKDLKAETGINYQLGAEVKPVDRVTFGLNLFRADIDNLIQFVDLDPPPPPPRQPFEPRNVASATRQGIEGTISASLPFGISLSAGASYIHVVDNEKDEVIPDIPRFMCNASASHTHKWMTQTLIMRWIDNNSSHPETNDDTAVFDYLLKIKLPFEDERLKPSLFFAAHDLTDSRYLYTFRATPPGRWFEGGIKLEF
jgi:vitamin B12 transporter